MRRPAESTTSPAVVAYAIARANCVRITELPFTLERGPRALRAQPASSIP